MYCSHCGKQMDPGARFCSACGTAWQPGAAAQPISMRQRLLRPRHQRFIAGVCAAFAIEYGWDLSVVRILSALALLVSGGTVALAYFVAWIIIPEAPFALPDPTVSTTV